jgi:hypothetical protein
MWMQREKTVPSARDQFEFTRNCCHTLRLKETTGYDYKLPEVITNNWKTLKNHL